MRPADTRGARPHIVLLHGWAMRASIWDEMATHLAPHFSVHAPDLPGYGDQPACEPHTLDRVSDALAAAAPQRVTLCGWSLGGEIALAWALRHPEQVERLVLIASTPCFSAQPMWEHGMTDAVLNEFEAALHRNSAQLLKRFLALQAHGDNQLRTVRHVLRENVVQPSSHAAALLAGLEILRRTNLCSCLRHVVQPALVVHGDRDAVVPPAAGAYLQRELPAAVLRIMSGAGHAPFVSQSSAVARSIVEFCNER